MGLYRIALVVDHFLPRVGGIELQVADLAKQLSARGYEVEIITSTPGANPTPYCFPLPQEEREQINTALPQGEREQTNPDLPQGRRERDRFASEIIVHRLAGPRLRGFEIAWRASSFCELRGVLAAGRFDVVHCHSSVVSPLAYAATRICRELGLPSVLTAHSLLGVYGPLFRLVHPLCPWTAWPTRLTAVSRAACQVMRLLSRRDDVAALPNGIDPAEWAVEPALKSEVRVTSVMRLNLRKRPHALLRAIPRIYKMLPPNVRPRFALVGDGPCRGGLERQARRSGISDRVEFLGTLSRPAIREVFRRSDLFALPTRNEAFGIAVLEARCAGLPVVAMAGTGVDDIIQHGQQGCLAHDDEEFTAHLARLIVDAELRGAMAARARQDVEQFDWDHVVEKHLAVYRDAIAPTTAAARCLTNSARLESSARKRYHPGKVARPTLG